MTEFQQPNSEIKPRPEGKTLESVTGQNPRMVIKSMDMDEDRKDKAIELVRVGVLPARIPFGEMYERKEVLTLIHEIFIG